FDVMLGCDFLEGGAIWKIEESGEIRLESSDITMLPTAVDKVILSIDIAENKLVDGLSAVSDDADERLAEQIVEGTGGLIGNSDADAADFFFLIVNVVGAEEEIIFAVALCDGRSPHGSVCPGDAIGIQDPAVLGPVDEIGRRECVEKDLLVV